MTVKELIQNVEDLKVHLNEISVYDLDVHTSMDLYYTIAKKFNVVIKELSRFEGVVSDEVIKQNEKLVYLLGEGLNSEVVNKINNMVLDGTMDKIINTKLFNDLNSQIKANTVDLDVERKRIDSLTKLAEGSTTGDAELIDARIGYNAVVYENVGNAIRNQVNDIRIDFNNMQIDELKGVRYNIFDKSTILKGKYPKMVVGVSELGDYSSASDDYWLSQPILINSDDDLIYVNKSNIKAYFYNSEQKYIGAFGAFEANIGKKVWDFRYADNNLIDIKYMVIGQKSPYAEYVDEVMVSINKKLPNTYKSYNAFELLRLEEIENKINNMSIIVDKSGNGNYTTIQDAIDNSNSFTTIYVKSGIYEESVDFGTKNIFLIGEDKNNTVIFNTTGDYNTPPLCGCRGRVENLTIYAKKDKNKDYSSVVRKSYGFHLDQRWGDDDGFRSITVENCIIKSDFSDSIGCGIRGNSTINIINCVLEATESCGLKVHPYNDQDLTSFLFLKDNIFKHGTNVDARGLQLHTGGTDGVNYNTVKIEAINNVLRKYVNTDINCFSYTDYSFGNTINEMNTLTVL